MFSRVNFFVFLLASQLWSGWAATERTGKVKVLNKSGSGVMSVAVVHKYSDNYTNNKTWMGPIANGQSTDADFDVQYRTGIFTTGKDWWFVTYIKDDAETMVVSSPQNFREIIDTLEPVLMIGTQAAIAILAGVAGVAVTTVTAGAAAPVAIGAAAAAVGAIAGMMTSTSGGTAGFKQHILRSEDSMNTIELSADGQIRFLSPSGDSTSSVKIVKLPKPDFKIPSNPTNPKFPNPRHPMYPKFYVDNCKGFGSDCGKPAADEFCRQSGYSRAKSFGNFDLPAKQGEALTLKGNVVCNADKIHEQFFLANKCTVLKDVVCQ
jgi:hypothetical protein